MVKNSIKSSRRRFIGLGTAALTAGAVGSPDTSISKMNGESGQKSSRNLLNVGLILGGQSGHSLGLWGRQINCTPGVNNVHYTPRRTGMYFTHIWCIDRKMGENFAKAHNIDYVVKNYDDMVGKVDGVFIDAFFNIPWYYKLARPYLEGGTPLFVNRPFADSMRKAKEMISLAKKYRTPIMTGSSFEHLAIIDVINQRVKKDTISGYVSWNDGTSDFYSHGLHGLWWAYKTAGGGINAVAHKTEGWDKGGGTTYVLYNDRGHGPFMGKIIHHCEHNQLICTKFEGDDHIYGYDLNMNWDRHMWTPLLVRISELFERGVEAQPDTYEQILEKTSMFIAGFYSTLRKNGEFVEPGELDDDWAIGTPFGHSGKPSIEIDRAYAKLFGPEKGEIKPPE
ncbi:MAG: hypothetical protein HOC71_03635 [Candidatus Latescibacteria bacterium]|jgi:hypothetical protein|nr:hypothetical protein [Candidatus Latescibacterota bacterium]